MTNFDPLLARNAAFAATGAHEGVTAMPKQQVFIITCMDSRLDPAHILGVELGDALVFRNAGGRVNDGAIHEIAFIGSIASMRLGDDAPTLEVVVMHHTGCGSALLADDGFNASFSKTVGVSPDALRAAAVVDPFVTVTADVERLRSSPLLPGNAVVSGHVYDVDTGMVETVVPVA